MKKLLVVTLLILWTPSQAEEITLTPIKWNSTNADVNAVFLTRGPNLFDEEATDEYNRKNATDAAIGKFYRVYFLVYEIYYSLLIEELKYSGIEGSDIEIVNTYFVTGFDIGMKATKYGRLTNLQFVAWNSWNTFTIRENDVDLVVRVKPNDKITVEKI